MGCSLASEAHVRLKNLLAELNKLMLKPNESENSQAAMCILETPKWLHPLVIIEALSLHQKGLDLTGLYCLSSRLK